MRETPERGSPEKQSTERDSDRETKIQSLIDACERVEIYVRYTPPADAITIEIDTKWGRRNLVHCLAPGTEIDVYIFHKADIYGEADADEQVVYLNLEEIESPEMLVLLLAHEIGHVESEHSWDNAPESNLGKKIEEHLLWRGEAASPDTVYTQLLTELVAIVEQHEREAWKRAGWAMMALKMNLGWSLASIASRAEVRQAVSETYVESVEWEARSHFEGVESLFGRALTPDEEAQIEVMVRSTTNPDVIERIVNDMLWGRE